MACRHHATNLSNLESGITLSQVSVMYPMQTQALYAVLQDFDLANSQQGLLVDEAASLQAKLGLHSPELRTECVASNRCFL